MLKCEGMGIHARDSTERLEMIPNLGITHAVQAFRDVGLGMSE